MVNSQWESVSCNRLNCSKCLTISANDCMEVERRRQTLLHSVLTEDTCFLMRSESYWSADFESSSALLVILSSCGLRSSISLALACWNRSTHLVSENIIYLKLNSWTWIFRARKKPPSRRPGQVDCPFGQVTFSPFLPHGQGPRQVVRRLNFW